MIDKSNPCKFPLENENENEIAAAQKKQPLFSFPKFTLNYLIPFMAPLFWEFTDIFIKRYVKSNSLKLPKSLFMLLSSVYLLGGLTHFIVQKFNNPENNNENENDENDERGNKRTTSLVIEYYKKAQKERLIRTIKLTALVTLIGSIGESSLTNTDLGDIFDLRLFFLIFTSLFYALLSKKKIYIHQIISLMTSGFGMFIVILVKIIFQVLIKGNVYQWYQILFIIGKGFTHSFELIISKYIMESLLVPPLKYLLISGIFKFLYGFLIELIIDFFIYLFNFKKIEKTFTSFSSLVSSENKTICILCLIGIFFSSTIFQILVYLTNYHFSPILLVVTDLFSPLLQLIVEEITGIGIGGRLGPLEFILYFIGFVICFIAMVIYNELVICNFCGLNENTAENIYKRGINEQKNCLKRMSNTSDDSNINYYLEYE